MISIICTDGQMNIGEIEKECVKGKWIPLLVLKEENKTILPVFNLQDVARKFVQRNLPKSWNHGCVLLSDSDIEVILKKGWIIEGFNFPRRLCDHPSMSMTFEIHEFAEQPDFYCS